MKLDRREQRFKLTPKGICFIALHESGFVTGLEDPRIDIFLEKFIALMEKHRYLREADE